MAKRNKGAQKWLTKDIEEFFKVILKLRNVKECEQFLRDLMTIPEIKIFSMRWKVAKMLNDGATYKDIEKQTGMSSTTIARINRWLEYGEGGYKLLLKRMKRSRR
jgi:TrpR-related protein YerC/YecD